MSGSRSRLHGVGEVPAQAARSTWPGRTFWPAASRISRARARPSTSPARAPTAIRRCGRRSRARHGVPADRVAIGRRLLGGQLPGAAPPCSRRATRSSWRARSTIRSRPPRACSAPACPRLRGASRMASTSIPRPWPRRLTDRARGSWSSRIPTTPPASSRRRSVSRRWRAWPSAAAFTSWSTRSIATPCSRAGPSPAALLSPRVHLDQQPGQGLRARVAALRLGDRVARSRRRASAGPGTSSTSGRRCPPTGSRPSPLRTSTGWPHGPAGSSRRTWGRVSRFLGATPELECVEAAERSSRSRGFGALEDSGPFVDRLLAETGVAVTPGRFFGAPPPLPDRVRRRSRRRRRGSGRPGALP